VKPRTILAFTKDTTGLNTEPAETSLHTFIPFAKTILVLKRTVPGMRSKLKNQLATAKAYS